MLACFFLQNFSFRSPIFAAFRRHPDLCSFRPGMQQLLPSQQKVRRCIISLQGTMLRCPGSA